MRRYREMSALNGGLNFYGELPDSYTLVLNYEHPLIKKILSEKENLTSAKIAENEKTDAENTKALDALNEKLKGKKEDEIETLDKDTRRELEEKRSKLQEERKTIMQEFAKENQLLKQTADLALLANNMLKGKELSDFIARSYQLITPQQ